MLLPQLWIGLCHTMRTTPVSVSVSSASQHSVRLHAAAHVPIPWRVDTSTWTMTGPDSKRAMSYEA